MLSVIFKLWFSAGSGLWRSTVSWILYYFICAHMCKLCVFCVFLFHTAQLLYYCEHGGVELMGLKPNPYDISSFSALTVLVGLFDL